MSFGFPGSADFKRAIGHPPSNAPLITAHSRSQSLTGSAFASRVMLRAVFRSSM